MVITRIPVTQVESSLKSPKICLEEKLESFVGCVGRGEGEMMITDKKASTPVYACDNIMQVWCGSAFAFIAIAWLHNSF